MFLTNKYKGCQKKPNNNAPQFLLNLSDYKGLKYDTPFYFAYISAPEYCREKFLYSG